MKIILASGSPRRKELLSEMFEDYEVIPSDFDENTLKEKIEDPGVLVEELSLGKAKDVENKINKEKDYKEYVIIAADTLVYFEKTGLGKPGTSEKAYEMLSNLQGKENYVYTGLCIIIKKENEKEKIYSDYTKSTVKMKKMTDEDIKEYIAKKGPLDKAGAYAIQGIGRKYVENLDGNFNAVVGLDTTKLKDILRKNDILK